MRKKILSAALFFLIIKTNAQWNPDTLIRTAICTAINQQTSAQLCTDDAKGNPMWGNNGIRIDTIGTSRLGNNVAQVITEDGYGGAFITWSHSFFGSDEIRIQHIDHNGNILLLSQGLPVSNNIMVHYSS